MRLLLVRHGESRHSQQGVIADVAGCAGLAERGVAQAQLVAQRLVRDGDLTASGALLTSPVPRARETAAILAAVGGARCDEDAGLCEVRPGAADGMTWDAYRTTYGAFDLLAEPHRPFASDGESWHDFTGRVRRALDGLAARFAGETVVAVSHAGFIVASALVLFDIPRPGTRARLDPAHGSLTEWRFAGGTWRLERFNDACHLRGLA